jgi:carbon storage regulator
MLVIRRRVGDRLWIGDSVELKVLELGPHRVVLGITAPPEVRIMREEVLQAAAENQAAAESAKNFSRDEISSYFAQLPR